MPQKPTPVGDSLENVLSPPPLSSEESNIPLLPEPFPLSIIRITQVALEKLYLLAQEVFEVLHQPLEVYALCFGEDGIISDILIPQQYVSFASIHIHSDNILALIPEIQEKNLPILGWAHSHANFGVFFSGTDDSNQKVILAETANYREIEDKQRVKYTYGLTVNIHRALYGEVSTQFASGRLEHKKASFSIYGGLPSSWDEKKFRNYIREQIRMKVKTSSSYFSHSHSTPADPITIPPDEMEIIDEFLKIKSRKIKRDKKILLKFARFRLFRKKSSSASDDSTSDSSLK
ncbi:MAG: hypothetical protein ACTSWW_00785 [Promethearchaeota archaeon]